MAAPAALCLTFSRPWGYGQLLTAGRDELDLLDAGAVEAWFAS
jgi:hypothetical protein